MRLDRRLKLLAKRATFPGIDLHTRSRFRYLPRYFLQGDVRTLDAGTGNGALALAAYRKGSRVLAVTHDRAEIERNRKFFAFLGIAPEEIEFRQMDLYDLGNLEREFDQIICSETLEHISDDARVVRYFFDRLKPGGVLHLCCPNSDHPVHSLGRTNEPEDGRHVRDGYTEVSYRQLLGPVGFSIEGSAGIGSPWLVRLDAIVRRARNHPRYWWLSFPLFLVVLPLTIFDRKDPSVPYSILVRAKKPSVPPM